MNLPALKLESENEPRLQARSGELIAASERAVIDSNEAMENGADLAKLIKTAFNKAETERKLLVKPFNDGVKTINSRFRDLTGPLLDAETRIKGKMLTYRQEQDRILREEEDRLRKEREAAALAEAEQLEAQGKDALADATIEAAIETAPMPTKLQPTRSDMGTVASTRKTWTFELTSIKALAAVRPDLVMVDKVAINRAIKDGNREIPGLKIFQKESLQIR